MEVQLKIAVFWDVDYDGVSSFETSETIYPKTQRNIPEDMNLQQLRLECPEIRGKYVIKKPQLFSVLFKDSFFYCTDYTEWNIWMTLNDET